MLTGAEVFTAFYLLLSLACTFEFHKLLKGASVKPQVWGGLALSAIIFLLIGLKHHLAFHNQLWLILIPGVVLIFIGELYRKETAPFANLSYTILALVYILIPFCFFHELGFLNFDGNYSWLFPIAFFSMLWASDTGAYLFGVRFGKTRLFERHSPKKSWEGFFGGLLTSLIVAAVFASQFSVLNYTEWAGLALIIVVAGTLGDLVESMLKRSFNTKDSGGLLPGHGGLLDRFDGLFLSAPLVYAYLSVLV